MYPLLKRKEKLIFGKLVRVKLMVRISESINCTAYIKPLNGGAA
jgi:hypothetical protein